MAVGTAGEQDFVAQGAQGGDAFLGASRGEGFREPGGGSGHAQTTAGGEFLDAAGVQVAAEKGIQGGGVTFEDITDQLEELFIFVVKKESRKNCHALFYMRIEGFVKEYRLCYPASDNPNVSGYSGGAGVLNTSTDKAGV